MKPTKSITPIIVLFAIGVVLYFSMLGQYTLGGASILSISNGERNNDINQKRGTMD